MPFPENQEAQSRALALWACEYGPVRCAWQEKLTILNWVGTGIYKFGTIANLGPEECSMAVELEEEKRLQRGGRDPEVLYMGYSDYLLASIANHLPWKEPKQHNKDVMPLSGVDCESPMKHGYFKNYVVLLPDTGTCMVLLNKYWAFQNT